MQRLTVGADAQIRSDPFVGVDGETPLGVLPTVAVVNAAGTTLAAPVAADDGTGTGRYVATLTAATHLTQADRHTVTWTAGTQTQTRQVDVASARYATVADLRRIPVLANPGEFPASRLVDAITEFEDLADDYRGVAYVRRVRVERERLDQGCVSLFFDRAEVRAIRSITGPSGALTATGWWWGGSGFVRIDSYLSGVTVTPLGAGYDITVTYEHGLDQGIPEGLRRACVEYVRSTVLRESTGLSRDVIATAEQGFVTRYSTPNWEECRPTGFLDVDRLLNQLPDRRLPGVA